MFAFKMMLASLPNVEPVTLMIIAIGSVFGPSALPAVIVYIFLELLVWGIGFWSISYLYIWPLLFFISCLLRKNRSAFLAACLAALFGFSFGLLCAVPMLFTAGFLGALSWWQAGALFDLIHGTANFILCLLLYTPLVRLLEKMKKKYAGTLRR